MTVRVRILLGLDPLRGYKVAIIRVSSTGSLEKLDDQKDTGIAAYASNSDFVTLTSSPIDVVARGWLEVWLTDLNPAAAKRKLGWVGVIGETIFVAVAGSAYQANLPPDPNDPAGLGRNAFIDLLIHAALAGHATDILAPFMSRWWRNDLWAETLMAAINLRLPNCTLWNGDTKVATAGPEKLVTNVRGQAEGSTYRHTFVEQVYTKGLEALAKGEWSRAERELPLGLRRQRIKIGEITKLLKTVEEAPDRDVIEAGFRLRARGKSWQDVGDHWAKHGVRMPGSKAAGRTFADYPHASARAQAARFQFYRWEDYYRRNQVVVRRTTDQGAARGQVLEYDPATGRRYKDLSVTQWPWRPFLTSTEWAEFDKHEAATEGTRSRKTGAATHERSREGSAFQGVPAWRKQQGVEETLKPETVTAYRWRLGSDVQATLRKRFMHRECGADLLAKLRTIEQPLAAVNRTVIGENPSAALERAIAGADAEIELAKRASKNADDELNVAKSAENQPEVEHWREKGRQIRTELRGLEERRDAMVAELEGVRERIIEEERTEEADITEPVLLASILNDGDKKVDPLVTELCSRYGITDSLRASWAVPPGPDGLGGKVRLTATANIPLAGGDVHHLQLSWLVDNTKDAPGYGALTAPLMRAWAAGKTFEEIAEIYPGYDADSVRRQISGRLRKLGIGRDLRRSLLRQPLVHAKAIIAARALHEPSLAGGYTKAVRADIEAAYLNDAALHVDLWCDTARLEEYRRVLDVFAAGDACTIDIATLARKASVDRLRVYKMLKDSLLNKVGFHGVAPKPCPWRPSPGAKRCGAALTIYNPAPETNSGLICPRCGRPEDRAGVLPDDYQLRWVPGEDGQYIVAAPAVVSRATASDHYLTVAEVAEQLRISPSGVRELDREGKLVPHSRHGQNSGRLYSKSRIDRLNPAEVSAWRERFGTNDDGMLSTADVAALLNCEPALVRDFANAGVLPVAAVTTGGHRRFRRQDVDALDRTGVDAYRLAPLGEAATEFGLPSSTLRDLAHRAGHDDKPDVRSHRTVLGHLRFDLDELRADLRALDLDGSPDNPLVSIGELAAHHGVRLSTGQVRSLTDRKVIPAAGRIGGKRRYRLADALQALHRARTAGHAPPPAGHLPPGRRAAAPRGAMDGPA